MTIETLAFLTILIIGLIALAVYRDYRRDKAEAELIEFEALRAEMLQTNRELTKRFYASLRAGNKWAKPYYINTDELGMQSAAYAEYEATPPFITGALERRADTELAENEDLPDWARRWLEESEGGE